jgi:ribosomal protein S12 methylthiotransferase accessory factor
MDVTLAGDGPAADAVAAALADVDATVHREPPAAVADADVGVVVGPAGADAFEAARAAAAGTAVPWLAVELGGVGGHPGPTAAVTGFGPATACYDCLRTRVAAGHDGGGTVETPAPPDARLAGAVGGRAAATLVAGDRTPLGTVRELPHAERDLFAVPGCSCADGRDRRLELTAGDRSLEETLAAAERAVDDRVGLVAEVGEAESFPAPYYLASVADTTGFSDVAAAAQAAGVDADWNAAFMKALGEALERYCAGVYRTGVLQRAPPGRLDGAVSPDAFVGVDAAGTGPLPWVPGTELGADGDAWLPAEFVQFPPPEQRFGPPITTGLGLGDGGVGAVLSGLYETVERDATMLSWYSTFEPLGLAVDDGGFADLAARARGVGLEVTPLLVTQDVDVPVVAVAVHREGDWPRFAVGSDADLDPAAAARAALAEALQNWMELRGMGPETAAGESGAIGRYADFPDAARELVAVDGRVPAADVGPGESPTGEAELAAVVERVRAAGLTPYAARVTTPDVASLGFEAVRVLVPAAQPLFTGDPTFGERAEGVPAEMGFEPRLDRAFHPYP